MATLQGVFRLESLGRVKLVMFASALRGNKPVSRVAKPGQLGRPVNQLRLRKRRRQVDLKREHRWGEDDEAKLSALGWQAPEGKRRNWRATFPTISPDTVEIAALIMATLQGVFRLGSWAA